MKEGEFPPLTKGRIGEGFRHNELEGSVQGMLRMLLLLGVVLIGACAFHSGADIAGKWEGKLDLSSVVPPGAAKPQLTLVLHVRRAGDGALSGTLDSPDQGGFGIPADVVTLKGNALHMEIHSLQVTYDAKLDADGKHISGTFQQRGLSVPLSLARAEEKPAAPLDPLVLKVGREVAQACARGDAHAAAARFDAVMLQAVPEARLKQLLDQIRASAAIGSRAEETVQGRTYEAVHTWGDRQIRITATVDETGTVGGLLLRPVVDPHHLPPDPKAGYVPHATLRLPFDGTWWVFWGGDTLEQNYHVIARDQRHAYDIVMRQGDSTIRGDGKKNEDYYDWGKPVLAPAAGLVTEAVDGVEDNVPGKMNPEQLYGNHVVIDLGQGEFAVICHFQNGSLKVKPGDHVRAGQPLGLCGNSGNSSEPHVHIHLQDRKELGGAAIGLPMPFSHYVADGKPVARGVPVRGQYVRNAAH